MVAESARYEGVLNMDILTTLMLLKRLLYDVPRLKRLALAIGSEKYLRR